MTDNGGKAKIDLASLATIIPFILAVDEQLTITWASEPVLRRAKIGSLQRIEYRATLLWRQRWLVLAAARFTSGSTHRRTLRNA